MGARRIAYDPLLDYWLKMASSTFGCIGIASAMACARPRFFESLIVLLGPFHYFVCATLIVAARANHLDPEVHTSFIPDIIFCGVTGTVIILPLLQTWRSNRNG